MFMFACVTPELRKTQKALQTLACERIGAFRGTSQRNLHKNFSTYR